MWRERRYPLVPAAWYNLSKLSRYHRRPLRVHAAYRLLAGLACGRLIAFMLTRNTLIDGESVLARTHPLYH